MVKYSVFGGHASASVVKNLPANAGDMGSIPGSGRSPGEGNGNLLKYSCLKNPMDRGARWATVTTEHTHTHTHKVIIIFLSS